MASISKIAITAGIILAAGAAVAYAAVGMGHTDHKSQTGHNGQPVKVFGISSDDMVFPYMRQPGWKEVFQRRYSVNPPRANPAFVDYALSSDPDTDKVCAVYAATSDLAALDTLKEELNQSYGQPASTDANGLRWGSGTAYVEIEDVDGTYQVIWDFTGTCYDKNMAMLGSAGDVVTANPRQYDTRPAH